ncbi:MAG: DUF4280 domain-containing protein [Chloroflexota bacterium]
MPQSVVASAMMTCTFGVAPSALVSLPTSRVFIENKPVSTIQDFAPLTNIMTFGMCNSPANPVVIAATAAKLGVFSPMPCIPSTVSPWTPGSPTVMAGGIPVLNSTCQCMCLWGGMISFSSPGEFTVNVS